MVLRAFVGLTVKFSRLMNGVGPALCPVTIIAAVVVVTGVPSSLEWREKAAKRAIIPINIDVLIGHKSLNTKCHFVNHNLDSIRNAVGADTTKAGGRPSPGGFARVRHTPAQFSNLVHLIVVAIQPSYAKPLADKWP
jgi:hypothetical protein